jgi:hypothetical protein
MTMKERRRTSMALVLGLATLAAGRPATAEEAKAVVPGSRVRVTTSEHRFVGRLVGLQGETIVLERAKGETLDIRRADVLGLEVSQRPGRRLRGGVIGALVGLGAAAVIGVAGGDNCSSAPSTNPGLPGLSATFDSICFGHGETAAISGILAVPAGALLGALIAPGEKWRPAGAADLSVQAGPSRGGGFGVGVAVGF